MKRIRTLVVDDEPLARERLTSLLFNEADIDIVGQCRDGEEAVASIMNLSPDLVFLACTSATHPTCCARQ